MVDALAASGLSGVKNAPILLINNARTSIPDGTKEAIDNLGVKNIYIVGGPGAVSLDIEEGLRELVTGYIQRVNVDGGGRYSTAAAVGELVVEESRAKTAIITRGADQNLVDSLIGGPLAYEAGYPILLVGRNVPAETKQFIEDHGIEELILIGGYGPISESTEKSLESLVGSGNVTRVRGDADVGTDRVGTSINFAKAFLMTAEGSLS